VLTAYMLVLNVFTILGHYVGEQSTVSVRWLKKLQLQHLLQLTGDHLCG